MISEGLRLRNLGSDEFTWVDLKVVVLQNMHDNRTAIYRAMNPDTYMWGIQEQLLAEAVDTLHWLKWAKTKGATQKPPQGMPEPIPRPGIKPTDSSEVIKFDVMTQDETLAWLGWKQPEGAN